MKASSAIHWFKLSKTCFQISDDLKNAEQDVLSKAIPIEDSSFMLYIAVGIAFGVLLVSLAAASCFFCPKHNLCRQQPAR